MTNDNIKYHEQLTGNEVQFLKRKLIKETKLLFFAVKWMLLACLLIPLSFGNYLIGFLFLLFFSGTCVYIGYHLTLRKVRLDLANRYKIIERCSIQRKLFMEINYSYHFYINSSFKISIEVSEKDFNNLNDGDEVSIEYTPNSKIYLGYF